MITYAHRGPGAVGSCCPVEDGGDTSAGLPADGWTPIARRVFPGLHPQVREVRRFVEQALRRSPVRPPAGADDDLVETACLLASEIATNAIRHTRSGQALGTFTVTIGRGAGGVTVEVRDQGARKGGPRCEPLVRDPTTDGESGRGLALVEGLAAEWGCRVLCRSFGPESGPEPGRGIDAGGARAVWFRLGEAPAG